jgi:hypothetical protein
MANKYVPKRIGMSALKTGEYVIMDLDKPDEDNYLLTIGHKDTKLSNEMVKDFAFYLVEHYNKHHFAPKT